MQPSAGLATFSLVVFTTHLCNKMPKDCIYMLLYAFSPAYIGNTYHIMRNVGGGKH